MGRATEDVMLGAPRYRRGSRLGAEHHAELFAAERGGGSRSRTRIELGSGEGIRIGVGRGWGKCYRAAIFILCEFAA